MDPTQAPTISLGIMEPEAYFLRLTFKSAPPAGEEWSGAGMAAAHRTILALAYQAAAEMVVVAGYGTVIPTVRQGETWRGGATAIIDVEHDRSERAKAAAREAAEAVLRESHPAKVARLERTVGRLRDQILIAWALLNLHCDEGTERALGGLDAACEGNRLSDGTPIADMLRGDFIEMDAKQELRALALQLRACPGLLDDLDFEEDDNNMAAARACPRCGERRKDRLSLDEDCETATCACGHRYTMSPSVPQAAAYEPSEEERQEEIATLQSWEPETE